MRRSVVLTILVVAIGVSAVVVVLQRRGAEPGPYDWEDCTTEQVAQPLLPIDELAPFEDVALEPVADVVGAVALSEHPTTGELFIADRDGRVHQRRADGTLEVVLDVTGEVADGFEQGLLGLVIDPTGSWLYLVMTDTEDDIQVLEYAVDGGTLDPDSRRLVLELDKVRHNHNGGGLVMGDDGLLWISVGDGGAGDRDVEPLSENAQDRTNLFGAILRIDPRPDGDDAYSIPADNPFVGEEGVRGEIWAYGLRNPWRFSVDPATGDVWIADVGQNCFDEIDWVPGDDPAAAGANFGWDGFEALHDYRNPPVDGATPPVLELSHADGRCSVTMGETARGAGIPELEGWTLFGDFCSPVLRAVRVVDGRTEVRDLGAELPVVVSFATGRNGELYVLSLESGVHRVVPASAAGTGSTTTGGTAPADPPIGAG